MPKAPIKTHDDILARHKAGGYLPRVSPLASSRAAYASSAAQARDRLRKDLAMVNDLSGVLESAVWEMAGGIPSDDVQTIIENYDKCMSIVAAATMTTMYGAKSPYPVDHTDEDRA